VALSLDEWLTPGFTANAEADKFHRAYAQKIGLDPVAGRGGAYGSGDINQRAQALFGRYQGIWSELVTKLQALEGYPVKTSYAFALGGAQCKNAPTQLITMSSELVSVSTAAVSADLFVVPADFKKAEPRHE
jgi:hypothetical protein